MGANPNDTTSVIKYLFLKMHDAGLEIWLSGQEHLFLS